MNEQESDFVHQDTVDHVQKTVYSMNNDLLDDDQKIELETWFQSPVFVSRACYAILCWLWHLEKLGGWEAFIYASLAGVAIAIIFKAVYIKELSFAIGITVGFPVVSSLVYVVVALVIGFQGHWVICAFLIGNSLLGGLPTGFAGTIANMILYGSSKLHPKYGFAKRHLGLQI